jgi:hypothetical protein
MDPDLRIQKSSFLVRIRIPDLESQLINNNDTHPSGSAPYRCLAIFVAIEKICYQIGEANQKPIIYFLLLNRKSTFSDFLPTLDKKGKNPDPGWQTKYGPVRSGSGMVRVLTKRCKDSKEW